MYNTKKKGAVEQNSSLFLLETCIKNCILNEKFNPEMTTFIQFSNKGREDLHPSPSSYAPASTACTYPCQQQEDRKRCEVYLKLTIKTLEWGYWRHRRIFIVDLGTIAFFFRYLQVIITFIVLWIMQNVEITVIC